MQGSDILKGRSEWYRTKDEFAPDEQQHFSVGNKSRNIKNKMNGSQSKSRHLNQTRRRSLRHIFLTTPRSSKSESQIDWLRSAGGSSANRKGSSFSLEEAGGVGESVRRSGRVRVILRVISRFPGSRCGTPLAPGNQDWRRWKRADDSMEGRGASRCVSTGERIGSFSTDPPGLPTMVPSSSSKNVPKSQSTRVDFGELGFGVVGSGPIFSLLF